MQPNSSHPQSSSSVRTVQRRRPRKGARKSKVAHFFRGIMMEGMGLAVLLFLYLSVTTSAQESDFSGQGQSPVEHSHAHAGSSHSQQTTPLIGHRATYWTNHFFQSSSDINRPLALTNPEWATWKKR